MSTSPAIPEAASARERVIALGCAVLGAAALLTAIAMAVDPSGFLDEVGGFGAVNEHLTRDIATWSAALGLTLLVAWRVASWRVPILAFAVLQGTFHTINHAFDADLADPGWKGWANVALLAAVTAVTAWLLVAARRQEERA
jgi:hypothetical protein